MRCNSILILVVGSALAALPASAELRGAPAAPLNVQGGFSERHSSSEMASVIVGLQPTPWSWATPAPFSWCGTIGVVPDRSAWRHDPAWRVGRLRSTAMPIGPHRQR